MKNFLALVVFFVCATCALVCAQTAASSAPAGPTKDPVATSLRTLLTRSRNNIIGAITAMPPDKFNFKPTPDQMTFAHLVVHIAETNYLLCSKAADVAAPKADELKETDSKDKMLAAANASFDFCNDALSKMDDSKLGDTVEFFGGRKFPRAMGVLFLAGSWADHYAAAAQDLRLNGILPPSAQSKK
jgi:uncharacterized damage-inducible protein DinB